MTNWPYFSSDEFLQPLADVYFPGARPEVVACEGQRFRVLTRGKQPVSGFWAYPFPLEPLADGGRARIVPYLADVVKAEMLVEAEPPAGCTASPLVRWDEFATFEEFESCSTAAHGAESSTSARKARERISRDLGELSFVADDCSDKLFETILCWKAAQYARGGYFERFSGRHRLFYEALRHRASSRHRACAPAAASSPGTFRTAPTGACSTACPPTIRRWRSTRQGRFTCAFCCAIASNAVTASSIS